MNGVGEVIRVLGEDDYGDPDGYEELRSLLFLLSPRMSWAWAITDH